MSRAERRDGRNSAVEGTGPTFSVFMVGTGGSSSSSSKADSINQTVWFTAGGGGGSSARTKRFDDAGVRVIWVAPGRYDLVE